MDIVALAKELFEIDQKHWNPIYEKARDDLNFESDEDDAQWDSKDISERKRTGRPSLTVDQLTQFIHQVVNDIRMNTPSINIIPADGEASQETAEMIKGLVRNIEYVSNADDAYDTGVMNSVKARIGFIRVDHDYVDDESFDQQLLIKRVINPLAVYLDSKSIELDGRDAKHGFVLDKISKKEFKRLYPNLVPSDFQSADQIETDKDDLTIVEFFYIEETDRMVGLSEDGKQEEMVDGKAYRTTRKMKKRVVKRYKLSGMDVLEETTFPGKYVPLVPVYGEEMWNNGKRNLYSLIARSKDAQRLYNVMKSNEIEVLLQQPKAPWMMAEGQAVNREAWLDPSNSDVLEYKTTDLMGNTISAPQRVNPPTISTGFYQAGLGAVDDIKATLGMYNASIGARSNETSGKAINARKVEGEVATYHFGDNLTKSICHVGRVLVCAIPEIYDTPRALRIIGEEEDVKEVGVNGMKVDGQKEVYDLTKGKYDVKVITGSSYTTKRQEAAEFFTNIVTQQPELMKVMGDLLFKYSDIAGAEAMSSRMKKVVDPKFLEPEERQKMQEEAQLEEVVDPEKEQMKAVIQQGMQEMQAMQAELEATKSQLQNKQAETVMKAQSEQAKVQLDMAKLELEQEKMQLEQAKLQIDAQGAQTEQYKAEKEAELKAAELALKGLEMQLNAQAEPQEPKEQSDMQSPEDMMQDQQEQELKAMQTAAIIQSIQEVRDSLNNLAAGVNRPKSVIYSQDGRLLGVE